MHALMSAMLVPLGAAWTVAPFRVPSRTSIRMCAAEDPPQTMEQMCDEASASVRSGLLRGKRAMRVDVGISSLDPRSPMYEPGTLARICLELAKDGLAPLGGSLLLLLPGFTTSGAATELLTDSDNQLNWPSDFRERVRISSLGMQGPPSEVAELPAAVVVAGLSSAVDSDDPSFRNGRAWLRAASPSCAALCVNLECQNEPVELGSFEQSYFFTSYGIMRTAADVLPRCLPPRSRTPTAPPARAFAPPVMPPAPPPLHPRGPRSCVSRQDEGEAQGDSENGGVALLRRAAPGPWRLLFDADGGTSYELLAESAERPSAERMEELIAEALDRTKGPMELPAGAKGGAPGRGRLEGRSAIDALEAAFQLDADAMPPPPAFAPPPAAAPAVAPPAGMPSPSLDEVSLDESMPGATRALSWEALQDTTPQGAMQVYQAEALLRCLALGERASFDDDAQALHCLGGVARSDSGNSFEVGAAVLLVQEGGEGRLAQLCVKAGDTPEDRARRAAELLARAEAEARRLRLARLVFGGALPEEAEWLGEAGFVSEEEEGWRKEL